MAANTTLGVIFFKTRPKEDKTCTSKII